MPLYVQLGGRCKLMLMADILLAALNAKFHGVHVERAMLSFRDTGS